MHQYGRGVSHNMVHAKSWYGKSCGNGYQKGCDAYHTLSHYSGRFKDDKGNRFYYVNGNKVSKYYWNVITNGYQDDPPAGTKFIEYYEMPASIQENFDILNELSTH